MHALKFSINLWLHSFNVLICSKSKVTISSKFFIFSVCPLLQLQIHLFENRLKVKCPNGCATLLWEFLQAFLNTNPKGSPNSLSSFFVFSAIFPILLLLAFYHCSNLNLSLRSPFPSLHPSLSLLSFALVCFSTEILVLLFCLLFANSHQNWMVPWSLAPADALARLF